MNAGGLGKLSIPKVLKPSRVMKAMGGVFGKQRAETKDSLAERLQEKQMTTQTKTLITLEDKAKQLDKVASKFSNSLSFDASPFSTAITLSQGIAALRELLDDGIMGEIMRLAGSPLGFMTDRKYQTGETRDAIIEASLRGFRVCGNEFNIIAGRFYGAKAGLHRKVISYPGLTDFKETFGIPKMSGDKGAIVVAKATWRLNGIKDTLEREFAIRVNSGMGVDAIIGKSQRKLYAAVLNQLSGVITPDGEVDERNGGTVVPPIYHLPGFSDQKLIIEKGEPRIFAPQAPQETAAQPETPQAVTEEPELEPATKLDQLKALMVKHEVTSEEILRVTENAHCKVNTIEEITEYFLSNLIDWWDDVMIQVNAFRKDAKEAAK
jgi:hypothetical protein